MSSVTVRAGDSMWAIAQRSGVSLQSLISANPQVRNPSALQPGEVLNLPGSRDDYVRPTPPPVAAPSAPPATGPQAGAGTAVVGSGDTMSGIADRHGVSLAALVRANPQVRDPNVLHRGDVLHIPSGGGGGATPVPTPPPLTARQYVVRTGDSLAGIATRSGVSTADLLRANPDVRNPSLIYPGQRLVIPGTSDMPSTTPVAPRPAGPAGSNPYLAEFTRAAQQAGVPESWASNPSLIALVRHESGFRPDAKNPTSSAYGLFQFLKSTWKSNLPEAPYGTNDAQLQALGGFRYIKQTYGTPERAWAFWQATVNRDVSLAPANLRGRAQIWIDKRYAGY